MVKILIGLYKHKETGKFDTIINQVDNTMICHNSSFELVKEFEYKEKTERERLIEECEDLQNLIKHNFEDFLIPVFANGKTSDFLDDKKINLIRENLYDFMCTRRKLMEVNEFEYNCD